MAEKPATKAKAEPKADAAEKPAAKAKAEVAEKPAAKAKVDSAEKPAAKAKAESKADAAEKPAPKAKAAVDEKAEGTASGKVRLLKVHHLRPAPGAKKAKQRVGRGEGSKGKTAGRGTKGSKARGSVPARLEGGQMPMHMRLPKLRGFKNPFRTEYQVVNLSRLEQLYPDGGTVTAVDLAKRGAVRPGRPVKVLGSGDITVALVVDVDKVSTSAKDKIVAAGGQISDSAS
ncbi:MAG: 50S ribosomal protein L15 [Micrococcales bacterium]|nr:50S ribosomal protein L15 [Micrococcales bacterium]